MSSFQQVFATEIRRLAHKEAKAQLAQLEAKLTKLRQTVAELERKQKAMLAINPLPEKPVAAETEQTAEKTIRLNAAAIKKIRVKLGLTQSQFATLLGASTGSVNHWENGKVAPQKAQKAKIASLRGIGKRELQAQMQAAGLTADAKETNAADEQ